MPPLAPKARCLAAAFARRMSKLSVTDCAPPAVTNPSTTSMAVPTGQRIVQLLDPQGGAFALTTPPAA